MVPYPAGGGSDFLARTVGQQLAAQVGQRAALAAAGVVFIGPNPDAIAAMGDTTPPTQRMWSARRVMVVSTELGLTASTSSMKHMGPRCGMRASRWVKIGRAHV